MGMRQRVSLKAFLKVGGLWTDGGTYGIYEFALDPLVRLGSIWPCAMETLAAPIYEGLAILVLADDRLIGAGEDFSIAIP